LIYDTLRTTHHSTLLYTFGADNTASITIESSQVD
jgi:hypothetical protein